VTLESFKAWKAAKQKKKEADLEQKRKDEAKKTGGRGLGVMSGRDLFKYDPTLFVDDADAVDDKEYEIEGACARWPALACSGLLCPALPACCSLRKRWRISQRMMGRVI
jgi:hypothetical protein